MNPDYCALGLPKGTCLEPSLGSTLRSEMLISTRKLSVRSLGVTHIGNPAAHVPKEAALGNHCTLGPQAERNVVDLLRFRGIIVLRQDRGIPG